MKDYFIPENDLHVGFTGTRQGMTRKQADECKDLLSRIRRDTDLNQWAGTYRAFFHHGDCIGADAEAHCIASELVFPHYGIIIHPPTNQKMMANCKGAERMKPKPYLERNHDIVDASTILIATPETEEEVLRSGTWATVRYARRQNMVVKILNP